MVVAPLSDVPFLASLDFGADATVRILGVLDFVLDSFSPDAVEVQHHQFYLVYLHVSLSDWTPNKDVQPIRYRSSVLLLRPMLAAMEILVL
jgi:hypothetical protein